MFLIEIMPVMFIPAAVGLLDSWGVLGSMLVPFIVITLVSTILVMVITGRVTQFFIRVDKKGKESYKSNETLSMNILEKKLDGTPILNTMNSKMVYDKQIDPLMAKVLSSGLKGGTVTLYGQAGSLYSTTPADLNPDTLISITFELIP